MITGIDKDAVNGGLKINNGRLQAGLLPVLTGFDIAQVLRIPMLSHDDVCEVEVPYIEGTFLAVLPRYETASPPAGNVNIVITEMLPDGSLGRVITNNNKANGAFVRLESSAGYGDFVLASRVRINVANMGVAKQLTLLCYVQNV